MPKIKKVPKTKKVSKTKKEKELFINYDDERAKKTIFGTTEKSNFILNMRIEQVDKLAFGIISLAIILSAIGTFLTEFFREINELPMMCFAVAGVAAMVFALVVYQKRLYSKSILLPTIVYAVLFLLAIVSAVLSTDIAEAVKQFWNYFLYRDRTFLSNNINIALKGFPGRGEGLFTLFCYICFYLIAVRLSQSRQYIQKLFDVFVFLGCLQCFFALFQIIPPIAKFFDFTYNNLFSITKLDVFLPNGASASPIIFANFLAIIAPIAIIGAVKTDSKKRKIFYLIATFFFVFFMLKSQTTIGLVGAVISLLIAIFFARKAFMLITMSLALLLGVGSCFVYSKPLQFYDTGIIWEDSSYRIEASGFLKISKVPFQKDSTIKTYQYLWSETLNVATETPVRFMFGVGEEQLALAQKNTTQNMIVIYDNTFDKTYNDFIYILATRGIFVLVLYILFLIFAFRLCNIRQIFSALSVKNGKTFGTWQKKVCIISCFVYLLLSLLSFSAIETTPIFFVLLGLAVATGRFEGAETD